MDILTHTLYLIGAASFVLGLHLMNSPASARRGNQLSAAGMIVAVATTVVVLVQGPALSWIAVVVLVLGLLVGGGAGLVTAQRVKMTAMPQLVSIFNAVGGGAAALIAIYTAIDIAGPASVTESSGVTDLSIGLDLLIGGVTFSGSLIAGGKLAGK
ncbi:MAG TPA: NAD(P)(+) transhydrogenase (Re/Si-specific) subunit beta, partial [Kineosporiaceae bacterium]|nr:NAD(P)(+) transhydrogenase (Re/Si-specific) subunit beta [Kineosporiaceae bacterium]